MDQRQIFLRDVLTVLFKRKFLIVSFAVLVVAVVLVGNYAWPPTYESEAKLRIMRGREVSQADTTVLRSAASQALVQLTVEDVNSEIELVYSNDVLAGVVKDLKLDQGLPGSAGPVRAVFSGLKSAATSVLYALNLKSQPTAEQAALEMLRDAIAVTPVRDSHVLEIRCHLGTPEAAHDVLAAVVQGYIKKHIEIFATPQSSKFFEDQMARVLADLEAKQKELDVFRNENKIISLETEQVQLQEQFRDAQRLLTQLEESKTAVEAVEGQLSDSGLIALLSRETESTVVTELQLRMLEKILRRNEIVQSKGPKHPDVIGINREIQEAQARLRDAIASTKELTERRIADFETRLKTINALMAKVDALDRDVKARGDSYEYYAQKVEESRVADALSEANMSNIKVVSEPTIPMSPISPRKMLNLVLALLGGIVGGVALAFFLAYLDHGLKTPEDVEFFLKIPPVASFFRSPYQQLDPKEAHRLVTMLDLIHSERPLQLVEVTSSTGAESADRVARAIAEAMAEDPNRRTALVDFVGSAAESARGGRGVVDVLMGECGVEDVISEAGVLAMLGRGSSECPAYLWNSDRMQALIEDLRQRFDRLVFCVPPVLQSHDSLNLARIADGIVLVIRSDGTRREVVLRAIEMLAESKGRVLGAVLTDRKQVIPKAVYRWI